MSDIEARIAVLETTDEHIKEGLSDIKEILKQSHTDNIDFMKNVYADISVLQEKERASQKKIQETNAQVELVAKDIKDLNSFKNKTIGWSTGASLAGGGVLLAAAKAVGILQ